MFIRATIFFTLVFCKSNGQQLISPWRTTSSSSTTATAFCPPNSNCVPITSCPILNDVLQNECVLTSRIGKLGCGYEGSGLVCCPQFDETRTGSQGRSIDNQNCGESAVQGDGYDGIGAYPWVARVGFRNTITGDIKFPCTGSIISKRVILTAAHCALAKADNFKLATVRVGEWLTNTDIDCGEEFCGLPAKDIAISHVIVHPGYQKQNYRHNIALLILRTAINYTVTAQPICLPEPWSATSNNGLLVGWGKAAGQIEAPFKQQVISVPIVNLQQCAKVYGNTLPITEENICAGGERGRDACSGFGGAPLLTRRRDKYYQVGILSFGSDQCGAPGIPSVYTDVKKYANWIKENVPVIYNS